MRSSLTISSVRPWETQTNPTGISKVRGTNRSIRSVVDALLSRRLFFAMVICARIKWLRPCDDQTRRYGAASEFLRFARFISRFPSFHINAPAVFLRGVLSFREIFAQLHFGQLLDARVWQEIINGTRPDRRDRILHGAIHPRKNAAAIYYRRLSIIIDAASWLKRDSAIRRARFFTVYWLVERFIILREIFGVSVALINNNLCLCVSSVEKIVINI